MGRAVNKYGKDSLSFTLVSEGTKEQMYKLEAYLVTPHIQPNGYNICEGGFGGSAKGSNAGEKNNQAKLTAKEVATVREYLYEVRDNPPEFIKRTNEMAWKYNVINKTIRNAITGRTWRTAAGPTLDKLPTRTSK